jgi:hypothetical protein
VFQDLNVLILFLSSVKGDLGSARRDVASSNETRTISGRKFSYWVALLEEKCTGANYEKIREFYTCQRLSLSRFGHSVVWQREWHQVFRFGREEDAETFMREFGAERMHPSERGKGKNWARWRKGTYKPRGSA